MTDEADPFYCYPCSRGDHAGHKPIAWEPDVLCECGHADLPLTFVYDPDPSAADASWEWAQSLEPGTRVPLQTADGELVGWATVGERVDREDPVEFLIGPLDGPETDRNPAS